MSHELHTPPLPGACHGRVMPKGRHGVPQSVIQLYMSHQYLANYSPSFYSTPIHLPLLEPAVAIWEFLSPSPSMHGYDKAVKSESAHFDGFRPLFHRRRWTRAPSPFQANLTAAKVERMTMAATMKMRMRDRSLRTLAVWSDGTGYDIL